MDDATSQSGGRFHPDLVLLNMRLPDLDGAEVTRRLAEVRSGRLAGHEEAGLVAQPTPKRGVDSGGPSGPEITLRRAGERDG